MIFHVVLQKYASKTVNILFVSIVIFTTELIGAKGILNFKKYKKSGFRSGVLFVASSSNLSFCKVTG